MNTQAYSGYTFFRSRSTPSSISSSQPVVEQYTSLTNDRCMLYHSTIEHEHSGQDSLRSTAQAFLECLDRHDHRGRLNTAIEGITRMCLAEILANCQPEAAMWNEGPWKYGNIDLQAISGIKPQTVALNHVPSTNFTPMSQSSTLQRLQGQLPGQEYGLLSQESVGVTSILGIDPPLNQFLPGRVSYIHHPSLAYHVRLDFSLFDTSEPDAQQFPSSAPPHGTGFEGQTSSDPSTSGYQERHVPVVQGGQERVKCTWAGCSSVIKKNCYTRHVDETHLRKVKAVCAQCGRKFPRTYMKKNHELTCRGRQSGGKFLD
jgi:hypothetical protein